MNVIPLLTQAGLEAVLSAAHQGIHAHIDRIALGEGAWEPTASATQLQQERARIPITGTTRVSSHQLHLTAMESGDETYFVRELALILDDGTVLAIWSQPDETRPLAYKTAGIDVLLGVDLLLSALPPNTVSVVDTGSLNLGPATPTSAGVVRMANEQEALEAISDRLAISPLTLSTTLSTVLADSVPKANQTQAGIVRLATPEEALGDSEMVAMSPATTAQAIQQTLTQPVVSLVWGETQLSEWLNDYDELIDYQVPPGAVMVGWYSIHNNRTEDRRYRVYYRSLTLS